jgi:hypothetical protein
MGGAAAAGGALTSAAKLGGSLLDAVNPLSPRHSGTNGTGLSTNGTGLSTTTGSSSSSSSSSSFSGSNGARGQATILAVPALGLQGRSGTVFQPAEPELQLAPHLLHVLRQAPAGVPPLAPNELLARVTCPAGAAAGTTLEIEVRASGEIVRIYIYIKRKAVSSFIERSCPRPRNTF